MKTGTRLVLAMSLLATGITLPVIASGDARVSGARSACEGDCCCQSTEGPGHPTSKPGNGIFMLRVAPPGRGAETASRKSDKDSHEGESPRARAERLGIWLHDWAERHPVLAKRGSELVLERELHPKRFLKALDDLPGPARRELIRAMDRLAQYERLLGKHPDDYRDFVHEHFPARFDHMMHLWGSAGVQGSEHPERRGEPRGERAERGGAPEHPRRPEPPQLRRPKRPPSPEELEEEEDMGPGHRDDGDDPKFGPVDVGDDDEDSMGGSEDEDEERAGAI
ncbi:MAG: hypothetical protein HYR85_06095 [Planctomycetes bacterium]|nr:hypothetical protein [Planctomycetota bacterium]MBI3846304.1 hypothetical protein [Planctomycetota bacterium]